MNRSAQIVWPKFFVQLVPYGELEGRNLAKSYSIGTLEYR